MVLGALLGAGIGIIGGISVLPASCVDACKAEPNPLCPSPPSKCGLLLQAGSFLFAKRRARDFSFLDAELDAGFDCLRTPAGPVPKDLREALEFTPMWTRWPDYERVRGRGSLPTDRLRPLFLTPGCRRWPGSTTQSKCSGPTTTRRSPRWW